MTAKETLDSVDLSELSDPEILDHLDRVSENLKMRNSLFPRSGPSVAADAVSEVIRNAVDPRASRP